MALGIVWYRAEEYPRILTIMEDADGLPKTFKGWLKQAEKGMRTQGLLIVRTLLDPDEFLTYCDRNGLRPVAGSRSRYAAAQVSAMADASALPPLASNALARFLEPPR